MKENNIFFWDKSIHSIKGEEYGIHVVTFVKRA